MHKRNKRRICTALTTRYHAKLRIGAKITHRRANSGILGETRREVLHERERTSVRDRAGTALTTQYHAKLRIGDLREAVVEHSYLLVQLSRRFALSIDDLGGSLETKFSLESLALMPSSCF